MTDDGRLRELEETVRDFAFALEVICSRIPLDEECLSGHESTAYQALVKYPEHVRSRHVRRLMGLNEGRIPVASEPKYP